MLKAVQPQTQLATPRLGKVDVSKTPIPSTPRTPNSKTIHLRTGTKKETHQRETDTKPVPRTHHTKGSRRPFSKATTRYENYDTATHLARATEREHKKHIFCTRTRAYISCQPNSSQYVISYGCAITICYNEME